MTTGRGPEPSRSRSFVTDGATRLALAGACGLALVAGSGCKQRLVETSRTAYIIGPTRDILPADQEHVARVAPDVVDAAVLIAMRIDGKRLKFCSGTLVAAAVDGEPPRVLSNHHCFAHTGADDMATAELYADACGDTTVYLGFRPGQTAEAFVAGCRAGSLRSDFDGDLSVFTLSVAPPARFKPLALFDGDPAGRGAVVVHYPDVEEQLALPPDAEPGAIKLPTAAITVDNCQAVGPFDASEWTLDRTLPFSIRHTCDLLHGSSGSGLIDAETGQLLGVNWGGIKIAAEGSERVDNVATKASYAAAFLSGSDTVTAGSAHAQQPSADAIAATEAGKKKDRQPWSKELRRRGCGVVGTAPSASASFAVAWLGFAIAGLAPVLRGLARRRKSK